MKSLARTLSTAFIGCRVRQAMNGIQGKKKLSTLVAKYGLQTLRQTSERMLDTGFIGLQSSAMSVRNSQKTQLYTYKTYETLLFDFVHNSRKNQLIT